MRPRRSALPDAAGLGPALAQAAPGPGGWTALRAVPRPARSLRTDLGGAAPTGPVEPVVALAQVSDLHVTDAQSPLRAEYLDRLGDPDSPVAAQVGPVGAYRTNEALTHHVVEAMTGRLRRIDTGPVFGAPVSFAVSTGDAADSAQGNEVEAAAALLAGAARVEPDAGDRRCWEGVGAADWYDPRYWHPDGTPAGEPHDRPRVQHGFPVVPGLFDEARRSFVAGGLGVAWHAVHGNHDTLVAGTLPPDERLGRTATGRRKATGWPGSLSADELAGAFGDSERRPPELWSVLARGPWRPVGPDPARALVDRAGWTAVHDGRAGPSGRARTWYGFDAGPVRGLVLDTVNPEGGWQGSIDAEQLAWLADELEAASEVVVGADGRARATGRPGRPVLLFSHHPLRCLVNPWSPSGTRRHLRESVGELLGRFSALVAWVNGHTHAHGIVGHPRHDDLGGGWWEITTASHVDWPQQARIVELGRDTATGDLVVATTVVDHLGPAAPARDDLGVLGLAGWSRLLAANDWQRRPAGAATTIGAGDPVDRDTLLVVPAVRVPAGAHPGPTP